MKSMIAFLIFLLIPLIGYSQMIIETPNGERRIRYELCDENQNCRTVEQVISYPICDEHHNCYTVNAFEVGAAKVLEEEEWGKDPLVFTVPGWM